ncbi:MAG: hypothetical protein AAFN16_03685 [Pseudomonadota bacterium]
MNKPVQDNQLWPRLVVNNEEPGTTPKREENRSDLQELFLTAPHRMRALDEGVAFLQAWLPGFERVIATTTNDCAVTSEIGIYQKPMVIGDELVFDNEGIAVRFLPSAFENLVAVDEYPARKIPPAISVFDASGATAHKCLIASLSDQLAFEVLMYGTKEKDIRSCLQGQRHRQFLNLARSGSRALPRSGFDDLDLSDNLDCCMIEGGRSRVKRLRNLDATKAWTIDRQVVPHFLKYISELRQPFLIGVLNQACLQMKAGRLDKLVQYDSVLELTLGANRTYFDPAAIDEFWIVQSRSSLSLEFYNTSGACVLVLAQHRACDTQFNASWIEILKSLPRLQKRQRG